MDTAAGAAQLVAGLALLARGPRWGGLLGAFLAVDGLGFAARNALSPDDPSFGHAYDLWGLTHGVAGLLLLALVLRAPRPLHRSEAALLALPALAGAARMATSWPSAAEVGLLRWGGSFEYVPWLALALLLPLRHPRLAEVDARKGAVFLGAVLACNLASHAGAQATAAGLGEAQTAVTLLGVAASGALWLAAAHRASAGETRPLVLVALLTFSILAIGVAMRAALGGQGAVQTSGFFGLARLVSVGLVAAWLAGSWPATPREAPPAAPAAAPQP
jgi:hypothetical protein